MYKVQFYKGSKMYFSGIVHSDNFTTAVADAVDEYAIPYGIKLNEITEITVQIVA